MTYFQLFQSCKKTLSPFIEESELKTLIEFCFKFSPTQFWINKDKEIINHSLLQKFKLKFDRLNNNEPLAYILGYKDFYNFTFKVNNKVLIPRPETEILVENVIKSIQQPSTLIEIGAGSGNIAVTLALETGSQVLAVEKSSEAYKVLQHNIKKHQVQNLVKAQNSSLFESITESFDILVSNPPYINQSDMKKLPLSVKNFEPHPALYGGEKGTEFLTDIIRGANRILKPSGLIFLEIGYDQGQQICEILTTNGFSEISLYQDFNQIDRVVKARI